VPAPSDWRSRKQVRVAGAAYAVRYSPAGELEVQIDGSWRTQNLFRVSDEESLQTVVEIMLVRYRGRE
jgi:muconolactone delta-isomerase